MILDLNGAGFDIDLDQTMRYYADEAAQKCDCAYCRNFSTAVDGKYPNIRAFLAQFGIDMDTPDESMPYDQPGEMWYENVYSVCGHILCGEELAFAVDGVDILVCAENEQHMNHACPEPRFFLRVGMMILPWVLDEPICEVCSPANEPSFLKKMWLRLIGKGEKSDFFS